MRGRSAPQWVPLFEGPEARRIGARVSEVYEAVSALPASIPADWGPTLLGHYRTLDRGGTCETEACESAIEHWAQLASLAHRPALYGRGLAGCGWMLCHLQNALGRQIFETDEIDEALLDVLNTPSWPLDYDLVGGLVGLAVYYTERNGGLTGAAANGFARIIDHLMAARQRMPVGISWLTRPELLVPWQRDIAPNGYFNAGVAHGVPGILWVLAQAVRLDVRRGDVMPTLEAGLSWVLSTRDPQTGIFPSWVALNEPPRTTTVSWCYGGLGFAATLLAVAHAIDRPDWARLAVDVAKAEGQRNITTPDAGICHGSAGNGHLFNRMYQLSGEAELADHARAWFRRAADFRRHEAGAVGGFQSWSTTSHSRPASWITDAGFLTGASGTALALLASVSSVEPSWDRLLLAT